MAAGQQKKRLTGSNLHEQYRGKKKKKHQLDPSDYVLNFRSHVQLEWDDSLKRAIAKREQVGVTWTDMAPFIDSPPRHYSGLADVFSVPQAIFDLDNLMEVLSYGVWAKFLSESDRKLLTQFLPSGTSGEQVLKPLLMGDNHHFGNPFLKWSTSLCSGGLHPDKILQKEQQVRADKKAYYSELKKYHNNMLEVLKKSKEQWAICKDSEIPWRKEFGKFKQEPISVSTERTLAPISRKEIPHEICVLEGDAAKYMSYIKISKQQFQLVKNLKQYRDGIHPKSLNRVLGDIRGFVVEPYTTFEVEQRKRLDDHWLRVANKDLSTAFDDWRDKKLKREEWSKSLKQELAEKMKLVAEEINKPVISVEEQVENGNSELHSTADMLNQEDMSSLWGSSQCHDLKSISCLNGQELNPPVLDHEELAQGPLKAIEKSTVFLPFIEKRNLLEGLMLLENQIVLSQDMPKLIESSPVSSQFDKKRIPLEGVVRSRDQAAVCEGTTKPAEDSSVVQQFVGKSNPPESITERKVSASFAEDMWQPVSTLTAKESHGCPSSRLSLGQPQPIDKCPAQVMDLERNADDDMPSFCSYANRKHDELLGPFPNGPSMMPSYRLRQSGLHLVANDCLSESDQLQLQFQEQQSLVEQNQARGKELYIHQVMNKNVYPNREFPAQRHFSSTDVRDFSALPSSLNGGMTRRSWFVDDHRPSKGWLGFELSSGDQNLGDAGTADGSLFSVLSECRKLPSRSSYNETRNLEQFIQEGNSTGAEHIHGFAARQLNSSTVSEADMVPPALDNTSLTNFSHQNRRSWNH